MFGKRIFEGTRAGATKCLALALVSVAAACTAVGPPVAGAPDHHRAQGFANPSGLGGAPALDFFVDRTRLAFFPVEHVPVAALPPEEAAARWHSTETRDAVQWLGHASLRLRLAGEIILVDPVLSDVLSPVPPFGPARASAPPVGIDQLMGPDAILITHNHYDHFEPDTVHASATADTQCLMPLNVSEGQEVTARMTHKTVLRKGLTTVALEGKAPVGTEIMAAGKAAGTLFTQAGDRAIAYLRFDRATGAMQAGDATVEYDG